jgi:hypothetical protein
MRRRLVGWAAALAAVFTLAQTEHASAQALGGVGTDPFSFYYGYYLPHQAYIAAQPRPLDTINQMVATRQYTAQTDRSALYDPISPYGDEELDPARPFSGRNGRERLARPMQFTYGGGAGGGAMSNTMGHGPPMYYNRTARYFPTMKAGRGPNRNIAVFRGGRGGGGGGMPGPGVGMPSPGVGLPGPR